MQGKTPILVALIIGVVIYIVTFCLVFATGRYALVSTEQVPQENTSEQDLTTNSSGTTSHKA